jgi:separase
MLEAVQHKFGYQPTDDLRWPLMNSDGISLPHPPLKSPLHLSFDNSPDSDEDGKMSDTSLAEYWSAVRTRYQSRILDPSSLSGSQMTDLPCNWSIVHINVTEDKSTLFIARQDGEEDRSPLIFCVPLKGRRDNGSGQDEEEHLTYEDALDEFNDIVRLSDEGTKSAIKIKADDQEARTAWWKTRVELDTRMKELLENIEFCWLGAFKVCFSIRYPGLRLIFDRRF